MVILHYKKKNAIQDEFSGLRGRLIAVAGPPGAGKSKFCEDTAHYLNICGLPAKYFPEYVNNALLDLYLESPASMKHYAFSFQTIMIQRRIALYKEALDYIATGGIALIDGPINTDLSFELMNYWSGNISEREHAVYFNILSEFEQLPEPDYMIYLNVSIETAQKRVEKRGRNNEIKNYDRKFYELLRAANNLSFKGIKVNCIPYDEDAELDETKLSSSSVFRILRQIMSRALETIGLPPVNTVEELKALVPPKEDVLNVREELTNVIEQLRMIVANTLRAK